MTSANSQENEPVTSDNGQGNEPMTSDNSQGNERVTFYNRIQEETQSEREHLLNAPIISRCLTGDICLEDYISFLSQAYHHVKHTTPLLNSLTTSKTGKPTAQI